MKMTGQQNGLNGDSSFSQFTSCWTIGLFNSALKYLTAETFGFKVLTILLLGLWKCLDCNGHILVLSRWMPMGLLWRRNSCGRSKPLAMKMPTPSACVPIWINISRSTRYNILKGGWSYPSPAGYLILRQHQLLVVLHNPIFLHYFFSFHEQFGNVTCDAEEKDNGARFEIVVPESSGGRWALRHSGRGYFLGAATDKLVCSAKTPAESELW